MYQHQLTDLERACGVTLEQVAVELERGVFRENDRVFVVAEAASPALASSVARCAFGGAAVEYQGKSLLGRVYARA